MYSRLCAQTLILGTHSSYQPCQREEKSRGTLLISVGLHFLYHPGPHLPSTAGETEAERGKGACWSHQLMPRRPEDTGLQVLRNLTSWKNPRLCELGAAPCEPRPPLGASGRVCFVCYGMGCGPWLSCVWCASHSMMYVSPGWCGPLCVCVSIQGQPLPQSGERHRSTPPPKVCL